MSSLQALKKEAKSLGIIVMPNDTIKKLQTKINKKKITMETKNGNITPEQIELWKTEHGRIHVLTIKIPGEQEPAMAYLRHPKRDIKATALTMYSKDQILECGEFLRDNCWLAGDERLRQPGDAADSAAVKASGIVQFFDGELGEL